MNASASTLPPALRRTLTRVAGRHLRAQVLLGGATLVAAAVALLLGQLALDRLLDLARPVRAGLLVIDLVVLGAVFWRLLGRPIRGRWREHDAAFALQRRWPELGSQVISAVQLSQATDGRGSGSPELVAALLSQVNGYIGRLRVADVVSLRPAVKRLGLAGLLAAGLVGGCVAQWPLASVLLARAALRDLPLPTATIVVPETRDLTTAAGTGVTLAARAEGVRPTQGRIEVRLADGERRTLLVSADAADPARFVFRLENVQQDFSYRFYLGDGRGPAFDVTVQPAPLLEQAEFAQEFPAYTGRPPVRQPSGALVFFPGSTVRVTARASQELGAIEVRFAGEDAPAPVTLAVDESDPRTATGVFTVPASGITGLSLPLSNRASISAPDSTIYPVTIETDRAPVVTIEAPATEAESMVVSAQLSIVARLADDFGLSAAELVTVTGGVERRVPLAIAADRTVIYDVAPAFENPPLEAGAQLVWWIEATDNNNVTGPGIGRSGERRLTIVTFAEKQQEMLQRLEETSRRVEEVARRQGDIRDALGEALRKLTPGPETSSKTTP